MNGGIKRAQRAAVRHQIAYHGYAGRAELFGIIGNDDGSIDNAAQPRELTVQNGLAAGRENQPGLVQPSKTPRTAAGEDGSRPHRVRIAARRISEE